MTESDKLSRGRSEYILKDETVEKARIENEHKLAVMDKIARERQSRSPEDRESFGTYIERNALRYPDNVAIFYEDTRYTYREFNEWTNRYANYLIAEGLKKGDIAAVMLENRPEMLMVIAALGKIGAVASLINTSQRATVLAHSLTLVPVKRFIIGEECLPAFEEVKADIALSTEQKVYFLPDEVSDDVPNDYLDLSAEIRGQSADNPSTTGEVRLKDQFVYIFTSGTTGMPKAVIITHFHTTSSLNWWGHVVLDMKPEDVMYITLPLFHGNGLHIGWSSAIAGGAAVVIRRRFSVSRFWKDVRKFKATAFIYVGEVCRYLMNQPPSPSDADNSVWKIAGNGLNVKIWKAFKKRFGIEKVYEHWGATEYNFGLINTLNLDCTVGTTKGSFALVKYDMETDEPVRGPNGFLQRVDPGEAGLMLIEFLNPLTFKGYTNREATEEKIVRDAFATGDTWVNTGDLLRDIGHRHAQFVDRRGDTFRWKGENVSTDEVAAVVTGFETVLQAVVYGVSIPNAEGRAGMASLVPDSEPDRFDTAGLTRYLERSLPPYSVPLFIRLKSELETTSTHKIRKNQLRDEGFDPGTVSDPIYVLLPGSSEYVPITADLHGEIIEGKYRF
ncbi:MAG: long-chain-acyl-CoA synthetase [Proteobacteria bacterium]|nr:long-chain-acyl-CoA synthetase [Pseudomonadota bacterium]